MMTDDGWWMMDDGWWWWWWWGWWWRRRNKEEGGNKKSHQTKTLCCNALNLGRRILFLPKNLKHQRRALQHADTNMVPCTKPFPFWKIPKIWFDARWWPLGHLNIFFKLENSSTVENLKMSGTATRRDNSQTWLKTTSGNFPYFSPSFGGHILPWLPRRGQLGHFPFTSALKSSHCLCGLSSVFLDHLNCLPPSYHLFAWPFQNGGPL